MKKVLATSMALCLSLSFCALTVSAKRELKFGDVHTETSITGQMIQMAADEINEKADDIHVTVFYNSTLGGSSDLAEGVQEGLVDIIDEGPSQFGAWIPKASQVEAPYLWQSVDHMVSTMNGEYLEKLNEMFDSINVRLLGTFYYGTRQLTTNKPINTLEDLSGMKIRVPQSELYVKMVESWGAAATPMALNELYMALQTGTVDGQENPLPTFEANKFYEVIKNVILTDHIICPNMFFINGDVWNSLSEHDQEVVQTAVDNAIAWNNETTLKAEEDLKEQLKEYDVEIITPDDTIREATVAVMKEMIEDWDLIQSYAE